MAQSHREEQLHQQHPQNDSELINTRTQGCRNVLGEGNIILGRVKLR